MGICGTWRCLACAEARSRDSSGRTSTWVMARSPSRNRVQAGAGNVVEGDPKTLSSRRTLPLDDGLVGVLKRASARYAQERLALGDAHADSGYVAVNEAGQPYTPDTLTRMWHKLAKAAGVRPIRLHDARHSCGTALHLRGVPLAVIAKWLGHADASITARIYAHSQDAALRDAGKSLGGVDAPIPVKPSSGGEPPAVVVGEGVVALVSAFEPRDGDYWDGEMGGDGGQGEVFGLPGGPQVAVVVNRAGSGEESENFAGDGAFEQPQDLFLGAAVGVLASDVVARL
jgi:Phage integrase family